MRGRRVGRFPFLPTLISGLIVKGSAANHVREGHGQMRIGTGEITRNVVQGDPDIGVVGNSMEIMVPGAAGISARSTSSLGSLEIGSIEKQIRCRTPWLSITVTPGRPVKACAMASSVWSALPWAPRVGLL